VLADAPLAYVRFACTVADVTGHAQIQRTGVTIVTGPAGIGANAGAFTGVDWVSIEEDWASLLGTNGAAGSLEAWVLLGAQSAQEDAIISTDLGAEPSWLAIFASAQGIAFSNYDHPLPVPNMDAGPPQAYPGPSPMVHAGTDQQFHHVVGTFGSAGCRMTFYLDGVEVATNDDCVNIAAWPRILIGASSNQGENAVHAAIADVAVYGVALSAARVLAHYEAAMP
jgi:hypothetical protein